MEMSERIVKALNENPKAKRFLAEVNRIAREGNVSDEEYAQMRDTALLGCVTLCPEAFAILAEDVYNTIRAEAELKAVEAEIEKEG